VLPKGRRLTARQFEEVYQRGAVYSGRLLVLRLLPHEGASRWGFAVGKKLARRSPDRAKWRRRLRAVVRNMTDTRVDGVITMRKAGLRATVPQLRVEVELLLSRRASGSD